MRFRPETSRRHAARLIAAVGALLALGACSSSTIPPSAVPHVFAIDADGAPYPYAVVRGAEVIAKEQYDVTNHLREIINGIRTGGRTNILLYLFGGANSVADTVNRAAMLSEAIRTNSAYYPVCVGWQSSLLEAYFDHLFWIRRGVREPVLGPLLSPFYFIADLGRAITRLPVTLVYHAYATASDTVIDPCDDEEQNARDDARRIALNGLRAATGKDESSTTVRILQRVVYALGLPIRFFTVSAIDAGGKNSWDVMIGRTRTAFRKSYTLDPPRGSEFAVAFVPPDGALALLASAINEFCASNPQYRVTLVGHSLGAMLGNELVRRYPDLPISDIVYMGAACSLKDASLTVVPYLRRHRACMFYNLTLHQFADQREYMWLAFLPRGSILEWIDTFLSDPITLDDLQLGKWKNAIRTVPCMANDLRPQIVVKAFGINDPRFNTLDPHMPETHTDFSDPRLRFWERAFWEIPAAGSSAPMP